MRPAKFDDLGFLVLLLFVLSALTDRLWVTLVIAVVGLVRLYRRHAGADVGERSDGTGVRQEQGAGSLDARDRDQQ